MASVTIETYLGITIKLDTDTSRFSCQLNGEMTDQSIVKLKGRIKKEMEQVQGLAAVPVLLGGQVANWKAVGKAAKQPPEPRSRYAPRKVTYVSDSAELYTLEVGWVRRMDIPDADAKMERVAALKAEIADLEAQSTVLYQQQCAKDEEVQNILQSFPILEPADLPVI